MVKRRQQNRQGRSDSGSNSADRSHVRRIGSLVSQLMSRRGYVQAFAVDQLQHAIAAAVGDQLASSFRVGNLRDGVLHVYAADSVTLQELNFRKRAILLHLQQAVPCNRVTDLRFRIQA